MSLNLFQLDPVRWRALRPKLTPMFTSGKLRDMFALMVECSKCLEGYLNSAVSIEEPVEIRELTAKYTTDVIGTCAFGINMNAINEENNEFRQMGKRIFDGTTEHTLRLKTRLLWPKFYDLLGFVMPERTVAPFFTKLVMNTIKYRREHGIYRPDCINMLMEFKKHPEQIKGIELTDTLLTAQAFALFAAGFETSGTSMTWALYELAQNHDIQDKVHKEIKAYHDKYGDTFTVESLNEMKYLDKVFKGNHIRMLHIRVSHRFPSNGQLWKPLPDDCNLLSAKPRDLGPSHVNKEHYLSLYKITNKVQFLIVLSSCVSTFSP
ncbi:cytochrome P450 6a8-like [Lasioglossum baleicum]|uniref:cytochrome P450 6a8-like n=1 Tax=Lasioglossum baleicum TaxID=434251 RepID=UPI003FCDC659